MRPATPKNDRLIAVSIYFLLSRFGRAPQNLKLFPHFAVLVLEFFPNLFGFEYNLNSYLLLNIGRSTGELDLSPLCGFGATKHPQPSITSHRDRDARNEGNTLSWPAVTGKQPSGYPCTEIFNRPWRTTGIFLATGTGDGLLRFCCNFLLLR